MPHRRPHLALATLALVVLAAALVVNLRAQDLTPEQWAKVQAVEAARVQTIEKVYGAVVAVYGKSRQGGGSGVLISPDGYALTNFHVVAGAGVEGVGGLADGKLYDWKLVGLDVGGDLALIRLTGKESFPYARLGQSDHVRVGDWAMAMGNPFVLAEDQTPTVTLGVVSGVGRYQPGTGPTGHQLEYGNCIQIDSSINPGNSGGPLFNMAAEVIGINGRGSFEERGRVNVGLGYAISIEQCKSFLPDLLAGKAAIHGTLDATFRDDSQTGEVICEAINLDSTMAHLGMELGDRLLSFDGHAIRSANHYLNLLCTLPAGWPVEVVFEHRGVRKVVWLRLDALPYEPRPIPRAPTTQPATRPAAAPATRPAPAPATRPVTTRPGQPIPTPMPPRPAMPRFEPGKIRDAKVNREGAERVLRQWTGFRDASARIASAKALKVTSDVLEGTRKLVSEERIYLPDGTIFDAKHPGTAVTPEAGEFDVLGQAVFAFGEGAGLLGRFEQVTLQGGDKSQNQRAYRVLAQTKSGQRLVFWFAVLGPNGQPGAGGRLLKVAAADADGKEADVAMTFEDFRLTDGVMIPFRRTLVKGIAETPLRTYVVTAAKLGQ